LGKPGKTSGFTHNYPGTPFFMVFPRFWPIPGKTAPEPEFRVPDGFRGFRGTPENLDSGRIPELTEFRKFAESPQTVDSGHLRTMSSFDKF
jgi:hypothetical protein